MIDILIKNWIAIVAIIVAIFIWVLMPSSFRGWFIKIWERILLLKKYWIIVIVFTISSFLWYLYVFGNFKDAALSNAISVYNTVLTLFFACIVWYFAFLQVQEGRISRLESEWNTYLNSFSYLRAMQTYTELYSIVPSNHIYIVNLLELYLILWRISDFDKKYKEFINNCLEKEETLNWKYLMILKNFLSLSMKDYDASIKDYLSFAKDKDIKRLNWNFNHVMNSQAFLGIKEEYRNKFLQFTNYAHNLHFEWSKEAFEREYS